MRNYYRSPAITELIRLSVELFEADPEAYGFRQVGYLAAVPERQVEDLAGSTSSIVPPGTSPSWSPDRNAAGEYLCSTWPDWEAEVAAVLHERRAGWADAMQTVRHLAARARDAGATIEEGTEVTGFELGDDGRVAAVQTSRGRVACEVVVATPGPWVDDVWRMLALAPQVRLGSAMGTPAR